MLDSLRAGHVALDVGCHKGGWLYWMRRAVGATGQVHAFEPQPELAAYLRRIVRAFGWNNVFIHSHALGAERGPGTLHVPDSTGATSASASLVPEVASNESNQAAIVHEIELKSLDHFVREQGLKRIDFVKIDVEGFEMEVLAGAQETLASLRPVVMLECELRHLEPRDLSMLDVFDQVLAQDYEGYFFPNGQRQPLTSFEGQVHQNQNGERFWDRASYTNNFLFVPNSQ